jgi:hypothetical protein
MGNMGNMRYLLDLLEMLLYLEEGKFQRHVILSVTHNALSREIEFSPVDALFLHFLLLWHRYYAMNNYPTARITVGQVSPDLLDAWYMLADRFRGQEAVISARQADMNEAARVFLESKYAFTQTKKLWYGLVTENDDQEEW